MLQVIDWLNENEYRAYPLRVSEDFPTNFLLDLLLVFRANVLQDNPIFLKSYRKINDSLEICFGTSSQVLSTFVIATPQTNQYPLYLRNSDGCLAVFGEGVKNIFAVASTDNSLVNIGVEPSTCHQYDQAWLGVSGITCTSNKTTIANTYAAKLPLETISPAPVLTGDVLFFPGYNFRVEIAKNAVDLEIGQGYGMKMRCDTYFLAEEYRDCEQIVSYINGIPPDESGNFRITQGADINITAGSTIPSDFIDSFAQKANEHSLFVGFSFQKNDICAPVNITPSLIP